MNRRIKFMAWDTRKKKMWSAEEMGADELTLNPDGRGFVNVSSVSPKLSQYAPHLIPLQFTGQHDDNGKEIYESFILESADDDGNKALLVVEWDIEWRDEGDTIGFRFKLVKADVGFTGDRTESCKIIGNIHENPELVALGKEAAHA